jgi:hypothetical protein
LLLLTAIIILVVISIVRSSNVIFDADLLGEKLKPSLTAISRDELEDNLPATSLANQRATDVADNLQNLNNRALDLGAPEYFK